MILKPRFGVILLAVLCVGQAAWADVTVRFEPPDTTRNLGDVFSMNIVADFTDPVLTWGIDLAIEDLSVVALVGMPVVGPAWVPVNAIWMDGDGLAGLAFPAPHVGTGILLATVTFSAIGLGETDLLLSDDNPADLTEGFGLEAGGFDTVTYVPGHVIVVPEPAALALLLVSAWCTVAYRRR